MANHSIKINRAQAQSKWGNNAETFSAMLGHIPASAVEKLTSAELAELVDAMMVCAQASKAIAEREAIENGFVWDSQNNRSIELTN